VLKARGHDVTICSGQGFDAFIEAHGLASKATSMDYRALLQDPKMQAALRTFSGKLRAWKTMRGRGRQQFDEMVDVARELKPDLMIASPKGALAHVIAQSMGIPSIPSLFQPFLVPTRDFAPFLVPVDSLGPWGNRVAHRFFNGLIGWGQRKATGEWGAELLNGEPTKSKSFIDGFHPDGRSVPHLHGYSRHIVPKPPDWGENEHITGYWFLEPNLDWPPPEDLRRFMEASDPPVYVGFGSMPGVDAKSHTKAVVGALKRLGLRGVLATGWGGLEAGQQSETIHMLNHAPHDWLFPRCAAVVHHGGAGTTHEGLRWGRPTVICPAGVDQPFWGRRVAKLGAGPKHLSLKKLTAERLAQAISVALKPEVMARAEVLGDAIRREDGAMNAADLICGGVTVLPERVSSD
jgi:sterol 3beta-glucosyltransferase